MGYTHLLEINFNNLESNEIEILEQGNNLFQDLQKCIPAQIVTNIEEELGDIDSLYDLAILAQQGEIDFMDEDYYTNFGEINPEENKIIYVSDGHNTISIKTNRKRYDLIVMLTMKYIEYMLPDKVSYSYDGDINFSLVKDSQVNSKGIKKYVEEELGGEEEYPYNEECIIDTLNKYIKK